MRTPETILRKESPTDGIENAIAAFLAPHPHPLSPRGERGAGRWPALAGLASALAVGATVLRLGATSAEASPLLRAARALNDAPAAISTSETYGGGRWHKADMITTWQSGVKRRERSGNLVEFGFDGRVGWAIEWAKRRAQVSPGTLAIDRIDDGLATLARYDKPAYRLIRTAEGNGETSVLIEPRNPAVSPMRHSVLRLAESGRPLAWTFYDRAGSGWLPSWRKVWTYPATIPAAVFAFNPPKGFRIVRRP